MSSIINLDIPLNLLSFHIPEFHNSFHLTFRNNCVLFNLLKRIKVLNFLHYELFPMSRNFKKVYTVIEIKFQKYKIILIFNLIFIFF